MALAGAGRRGPGVGALGWEVEGPGPGPGLAFPGPLLFTFTGVPKCSGDVSGSVSRLSELAKCFAPAQFTLAGPMLED